MSNTAKSIVAVVVGFVAIVVLSIGADQTMRAMKVFPGDARQMSNQHFIIATIYRTLISIFGCYLAARLAPTKPMNHALLLGAIGLVFSGIGVAASYAHPELGPHWYPIALLAVTIPCAWFGGIMGQKKSSTAE